MSFWCLSGLVLELQLLDVLLHSLDGVLEVVIMHIVELVLLVEGQLPTGDSVAFKGLVGVVTPGDHIEGVTENAYKERGGNRVGLGRYKRRRSKKQDRTGPVPKERK